MPASPVSIAAADARSFKWFDVTMAAFVAILLLSNVIGAAKMATLGPLTFGAGILFFPVSYVIGDILPRSMAMRACGGASGSGSRR